MKNSRRTGLILGLIVLAGALAPAAPRPLDANRALAKQQLEVARTALGELDQMVKGGQVLIDDPRITLWERRKVEALRASGATKAELVAALEAYVKRMKTLQEVAKVQFERAVANHLVVHEAAFRAHEAEMWLNEEKSQ